MVICPERGANDLHMVWLRPLPPHHLCFRKIQNGYPSGTGLSECSCCCHAMSTDGFTLVKVELHSNHGMLFALPPLSLCTCQRLCPNISPFKNLQIRGEVSLLFTNLLIGRSSAQGVKCDGARILNSRAERNRAHLAFQADRHDFVVGGDGERSRGDAAGSTSVDCGASGLELDGDVIAGDGKDLQSMGNVEWCESALVITPGDANPRLTDILRRSDSSLAAR